MSKKIKNKIVIGKVDKIDLVDMNLFDLSCKIDTGAQTSAIHCHHVSLIENGTAIKFLLLDPQHPSYNDKEFISYNFSEKQITNSFGQSEFRYVIDTKVLLFGQVFPIQFTLSDRQKMKFPVLIGRKFLQKQKLLVDVCKSNVSFKNKIKNSGFIN